MKKTLCILMALVLTLALCACGEGTQAGKQYPDVPGLEDGILTVGMECNYAPYNWTQNSDANGAVPIVNNPGMYANGYDVIIARKIADHYGVQLEIMALEWGGLCPALGNTIDAVIAGQSMTADRLLEVDMAGPYYYATIVCLTKEGSANASAAGMSQLTGTCTSQSATTWYNSCLPQVPGATVLPASESATAMIMALVSGTVDFICTDMPTAKGACAAYDGLKILDFEGSSDNFTVDQSEIDIGISVAKGNTALKDMMDAVLSTMTAEDFDNLMDQAISIQPGV